MLSGETPQINKSNSNISDFDMDEERQKIRLELQKGVFYDFMIRI